MSRTARRPRGPKKLASAATGRRGRRSGVNLRARHVVPLLLAAAGWGFGCGSKEGPSAPPVVGPSNNVANTPARGSAERPDRPDVRVTQKIVRASFPRLRKCYEAGLARDPTIMGRVSVEFVIERDGSVSRARESREPSPEGGLAIPFMAVPEVTACIVAAYRELRFPPFWKPTTVVYPIVFAPGDP